MNKSVAAVVVTYNRKDLLIECLEALLRQTYCVSSIIIVDNASTDGTTELLEIDGYLNNEIIDYHRLSENIGGAGGFNYGINIAYRKNYDLVWIMDDDTIPIKTALEKLIESLEYLKDEKIGFLCSNVRNQDDIAMNVPTISKSISNNGYPSWSQHIHNQIVEVQDATFVSVLLPQDTITNQGLPWKDFFIWGDDTEYTLRITRNFGKGFFVGSSLVIHKRKGGEVISIFNEENKNRIKLYFYSYRNNLIIRKNYFNNVSFIRYCCKIFKDILRITFKSNKYKLSKIKVIIKAVLSFCLTTYDKKSFIDRRKV